MNEKRKAGLIAAVAAASGFCNALLGAGGGILLSLTLGKLYSDTLNDKRDLLVNAQASMILGCAISCMVYASNGKLDTTSFSIFAFPSAIGGTIGSLLLPKIDSKWISMIFSVLIIWSGIRMIIG